MSTTSVPAASPPDGTKESSWFGYFHPAVLIFTVSGGAIGIGCLAAFNALPLVPACNGDDYLAKAFLWGGIAGALTPAVLHILLPPAARGYLVTRALAMFLFGGLPILYGFVIAVALFATRLVGIELPRPSPLIAFLIPTTILVIAFSGVSSLLESLLSWLLYSGVMFAIYFGLLLLDAKNTSENLASYSLRAPADSAVPALESAIWFDRTNIEAHEALAWILATSETAALRDGKRAVEHAQIVCKATEPDTAECLDTLAAAYAEAGDFEQAVRTQKQVLELKRYEQTFRDRLNAYEAKRPWRAGWGNPVRIVE